MKFKARVLLELGAELISSDSIALYELIKNGLDAGSKKIGVHIQIAMQPSRAEELRELYRETSEGSWDAAAFRRDVEERLSPTANQEVRTAFMEAIGERTSSKGALAAMEMALFNHNSIVVSDTGSGMDSDTLLSGYLTVGTPTRLKERHAAARGTKPPLGEKGIGRLAAMRLGHYIHVETGMSGSKALYELELDWRPVFANYDMDASELTFAPKVSRQEKKRSESGTRIRISDIQSDWDEEKIERLASTEFAKLADPFDNNFANQFLSIHFQGQKLSLISGFQSSFLRHADAICTINFRMNQGDPKGPTLQVATEYLEYKKAETVEHSGAHLNSTVSYQPRGRSRPRVQDKLTNSDAVIAALRTVGDFTARFYWFNRGRIQRTDRETWRNLEPFVRTWSGGLLVYRDGFRVYPYGSSSDDWLDLDRKALASSAYKLNRAQIIGYLRISTSTNPRLQDQTNREGFRDCPEKEALRRLLRQAIISDCKTFLETVDRQANHVTDEEFAEVSARVDNQYDRAAENLKGLQRKVPEESGVIASVLAELKEMNDAWERAKETITSQQGEIEQYIHLAGVGLMVELIAHELARSTDMALDILDRKNVATSPPKLESLQAQLKTINKRVRVLDELSIPGRQRKSENNVYDIAMLVKDLYEFRALRHGVVIKVSKSGSRSLIRRVEKGQLIQILDNLLGNSMYWLNRRLDRRIQPRIDIEIDGDNSVLRVTDNGPGIPTSLGTRVFDPFFTTKPAGEGRGLGLYISQRLASDNQAKLVLIEADADRHPGFALKFEGAPKT